MELVDLTPTAMAAGGDALARLSDGRVVFVEGALPGEVVRARVVSSKKDFARAVVVDVVSPSADRVEGHGGGGGGGGEGGGGGCGCTWSFVARAAQPALKEAIVVDALRRIGRLPSVGVRSTAVEGEAQRTTVRLGVEPSSGALGHRRRHSNDVVATPGLPGCTALHPSLAELVSSVRFPPAREVVLRVGVASGERAALVVDGSASGAVVPDGVGVGPRSMVHEAVAGAWLQVSTPSFFQSGPVAAEALVAAVSAAVGGSLPTGGRLVDAYAGVGLFGATLGVDAGASVIAIESARPAVADARVNLADVDAVVVEGEVGEWRPAAGERVDVVVADPARSGLGRPGVATVDASGADVAVLVSCDPASLARDARLLVDLGWVVDGDVVVVDAFPDTFHVEAVTRFTRRGRGHDGARDA